MISSLLYWLTTSPQSRRRARLAYGEAVRAARDPRYYTEFAVEDTVDGRFDMIVLQVFLMTRESTDMNHKRLLTEALIEDMDRNLREMGVGDMSVGKKVEKMAYALNGRLQSYAQSWSDEAAFSQALWRNLYRSVETKREPAEKLAQWLLSTSLYREEAKDCA